MQSKVKNTVIFILFCSLSHPVLGGPPVYVLSGMNKNWPFEKDKKGFLECTTTNNGEDALWLRGQRYTYALNDVAINKIPSKGSQVVDGREHSSNPDGLAWLIEEAQRACD